MSHEHFKENLVAIKAESQRKQMEKDLMYQNMISEGKQKQEDWKLKMGLYDLFSKRKSSALCWTS